MKRRSLLLFCILILSIVVSNVFAVQQASIRVQMYNANLAARINTIYPWYRITNTGSTPVNLADVKIRYFYTIDGEKPQVFKCDWSSIGNANVTGTFIKMDSPSANADYYFELGFKSSAGYLQPGKSIDVQSRFYKNDWSNYNQTNDYSFNPTAQRYVDWDKIAVQVGQGAVEDFVTSCDFTKDNQWVQDAVTIHLSVKGNGSDNATTYYSINDGEAVNGKVITLNNDGIYKVSFWSKGRTDYTETHHAVTVKIDRTGPVVTGSVEPAPNANGWLKSDATVTFTATDALSGVVSITPAVTIATEGANQVITGEAKDNLGNHSSTTVTVNIDKTPPVITEIYPKNGSLINQTLPTISVNLSDNLSGIDAATVKMTVDGNVVTASVESGQVQYMQTTPLSAGKHTVRVWGSDKAGNASVEASSTFTVDPTLPNLPPDPAEVAPKLDTTVCTSMIDATSFLYTGDHPIQTGVEPETIVPKQAAVLRGKVLDQDGQPLPGVKITVLNHPEYGQTYSRADGMFDMAVNGGGYLTVKYGRDGYLGAQRQINVPWQDYAWLPEAWLVQKDSQATTVALNNTELQVARGSVIMDNRGNRQPTLIIPSGTSVTGYSGKTINIRATEFTVGENGPKKMPAALPANSAYTYCVDFSADETDHIQFNQPIYFYLENFLNFPVGGNVPTGYYNENRGVWVPSDNGLIIRILSINNSLADIDLSGNGQPANAAALASLGFTDAERQKLATLYQPGQSLWRVPFKHFSIEDCNFGWTWPSGATGPNGGPPKCSDYDKNPHRCYIERENQSLRDSVGITGTPFTLNYTSDRAPSRLTNRAIHIPLSGNSVPTPLKRIDLEIDIAGQHYTQSFSNSPNQSIDFIWDGKDGYGRQVVGLKTAIVKVGFAYNSVYRMVSVFGGYGEGVLTTSDSSESAIWQTTTLSLGTSPGQTRDLNGWSLNVHHFYDAYGKTLYLGDGNKRDAKSFPWIANTIVGLGQWLQGYSGDGGPAKQARISGCQGMAIGSDGSVYFVDSGNYRVRRIDPNGIITTVAGTGINGFSGDGGPATQANLLSPTDVAVGLDGSLYIGGSNRVRKVGPDGIITTIVGTGVRGYSGDGGLATQAEISYPYQIAVGPDGSIYIADDNNTIRRVGPDGIISTVAGNGQKGYSGDGGPATKAKLDYISSMAVGPDGSIYLVDNFNYRIRKVGPDGTINTIAGTGMFGDSGDGDTATEAKLNKSSEITIGPDGCLYITDNYRIRRIDQKGIISTVAGTNSIWYVTDGAPAFKVGFQELGKIAISPDGSLYVDDTREKQIVRFHSCLSDFTVNQIMVCSEDGREVYIFDTNGRHLKTLDAVTKTILYQFTYDDDGQLVAITDMNGHITTIARSGNQTVITAPFGQKTTLISSEGYLETFTNPAGESRSYSYKKGGLLETISDPKGMSYHFLYDSQGRAIQENEPDGGLINLERIDNDLGYEVKVTETKDSNHTYVKTFAVEKLPTGETHETTKEGNIKTEDLTISADESYEKFIAPDGTVIETSYGSDPRFGMQAPIVTNQTVTTPGGLKYSMTGSRKANLSDLNDPYSFTQITDTVTINGKTFTSMYNCANRTVTSTSPMGRQTVTTLDEKGRVVKVEVPGIVPVTFEYDEHGRLYKTTQGSGSEARISSIVYNPDGWVESVTDPLLQTTHFEYDAVGRVKKQTLPDNRVIQFNYDSNGNMTTLTPPGKPEHGFSYNNVNLTDKYTPPTVTNGGETSYQYNLAKQPTLVTRPDGKTIGFEYDTMGRLVTLTLPDGEIAYTYDATTGQLKNVIGRDGGALTYGYDGELPTSVTWGGTIKGKVGITYNNDFNVVTQSVNDGQTVSYAYDNDGLLTQAGDLTASYDPQNGAIQGTTIGNVTDSYGYTPFGEVKDYSASVSGVGVYSSSFTYDKLGRISTKTETVNGETHTYQYGYDSIGQLTDVWVDGSLKSHYDYDSNGNRVGGTYDDQDRMTKYGENTYSYSANGELQEKVTPTGTTKYEYDTLGNLTAVTLEDGTKIEYVIDGANRRVGKKVNGVLVQGWLYENGLKPVAELDGAGNVVSRFVYGTSDLTPNYIIKNQTRYRIISDNQGSPRVIVDVETGQVVERINYDEFGNVIRDTNPGFISFGFTGGIFDNQTGLLRLGFRDYNAETGRWTCKDPIRFGGENTNLYVYCGNEPINWEDPWGLNEITDNIKVRIPNNELIPPSKPGNAPISLKDGNPIEIHHGLDGYYEMTRTDHRLGENYIKNHPNCREPSNVNRSLFNSQRRGYYNEEMLNGRFKGEGVEGTGEVAKGGGEIGRGLSNIIIVIPMCINDAMMKAAVDTFGDPCDEDRLKYYVA